jgi:long-subunit fatty acid transport protein
MRLIAIAILTLVPMMVNAAGYEKNILWSGKNAAFSGAGASVATGAEALYFNPANMFIDNGSQSFSFNFAPTFSNFEGPMTVANESETSKQGFSPVVSLLYARNLNEKWVLGVGAYVAGGTNVEYEGVKVGSFTHESDVASMLRLYEFSLAAGYKINDKWKVGLGWRALMASATLKSITVSGSGPATTLTNSYLENMESTEYTGFRLGLMYEPKKDMGFGLSYRSEMAVKGEGKVNAKYETAATVGTVNEAPEGDVEIDTVFPAELSLSGHRKVDNWMWVVQFTWTNYQRVEKLEFKGKILGNDIPAIDTKWNDQYSIRVGSEYSGYSWPIRFGVSTTTAVTNADYPRPTFTAPGQGYGITLGTGKMLMSDKLSLDGSFEYTWAEADVGDDTKNGAPEGTYKSAANVLYLGATYTF